MKTDLASVLKRVGRTSEALLNAIQGLNIHTLEEFEHAVDEAYELNGWSRSKGRPTNGRKLQPAPDAVQLYLNAFRNAYRLGLDVQQYETIRELRDAVKAVKKPVTKAKNELTVFMMQRSQVWKQFPDDKKLQVLDVLDQTMRRIAEELNIDIGYPG